MNLEQVKKLDIPKKPGAYQFYDKSGEIIYIGKAADLKNRVFSYWLKSTAHTPAKFAMVKQIEKIKWVETDSEIEALLLESNLVKKYQPPFNVLLRDDKRFAYIKISLEDEIPGVFITRKVDKSGRYFGPFTSALPIRETLKTIRKIWPYCTTRKPQKKPCFYYQINLCTGVCGGIVNRKDYIEKVIKPIELFLSGKKPLVIKQYQNEIKKFEKEKKSLEKEITNIKLQIPNNIQSINDKIQKINEEIYKLNFKLKNIHTVLEHSNILGVGEKYANDVIELAKVLGLKKVPERIEGYDIANIFGKEAVGSMVVFSGGEPDKNEYRKFKIKREETQNNAKIREEKADDVGMIKEILERRMGHILPQPLSESREELQKTLSGLGEGASEAKRVRWLTPDLIIIDGGKAQLNVALSVLKKHKLDIPVIAISKGDGLRSAHAPDKLFFPGEKKPLELPLASPALHLIKRVRDEAHRFAITYHRKLRGKRFLGR